jgi:tRNA threonylcarbamoyladenosine biosynthesis protein TsaE
MRIESTSSGMTKRIAAALAPLLSPSDLVAMDGPLGAGKTCFAQGLAEGLGLCGVVASPSFVLARHYPGFLHVDAYRLASEEEFLALGLEEQLRSSITVVEWASHVNGALPEERLDLRLEYAPAEETRFLELTARTDRGRGIVRALADALGQGRLTEPAP